MASHGKNKAPKPWQYKKIFTPEQIAAHPDITVDEYKAAVEKVFEESGWEKPIWWF